MRLCSFSFDTRLGCLHLQNACATSENNAIYSGSFKIIYCNKKYFAVFVTFDNAVAGLEKKNPVN